MGLLRNAFTELFVDLDGALEMEFDFGLKNRFGGESLTSFSS